MHCTDCGYPLNPNASLTCAECGRPFDPADERSFDDAPRAVPRQRLRRTLHIISALLICLGILGAIGTYVVVQSFRGGPLGNDSQTRARLVQAFQPGLAQDEAQHLVKRLGGRNISGPDQSGILRFSIPAGFLNEVQAELHFDRSGRLTDIRLTSVYTG
jgi:hypothetical protein